MRNSAGTPASAFGSYVSKMPASSAFERNVLSTPKRTSPSGLPFVRIAWLSIAPASPALTTLTVMPVSFVNAFSTPSEAANESWVSSRIVTGLLLAAGRDAPSSALLPHAASASASDTSAATRLTAAPPGGRLRRR
jgi:hypothetical protein